MLIYIIVVIWFIWYIVVTVWTYHHIMIYNWWLQTSIWYLGSCREQNTSLPGDCSYIYTTYETSSSSSFFASSFFITSVSQVPFLQKLCRCRCFAGAGTTAPDLGFGTGWSGDLQRNAGRWVIHCFYPQNSEIYHGFDLFTSCFAVYIFWFFLGRQDYPRPLYLKSRIEPQGIVFSLFEVAVVKKTAVNPKVFKGSLQQLVELSLVVYPMNNEPTKQGPREHNRKIR